MGEVYLAEDPQIERTVALKTVRLAAGRPAEVEERKQRLLREAKAAGRLLHSHIVTLFDAGEEGEVVFLAFEYVAGSDLEARLREGRALTLEAALEIGRQAAEGLAYAHRQGVVHRDVKPSNLLLTPEGSVKISDFGIAKITGETSDLTRSGSVVGSPHYLSPEQIRGEALDGRTDIFSLGVVLYELLSGRRPFEGDTLTTLVYQILHRPHPALVERRPNPIAGIEEILDRMLAKGREERYQEASQVAAALAELIGRLPRELLEGPAELDSGAYDPTRRLASGEAVARAPTGATPPAPRGGSRRGLWLVAAVAAVLLATVAGGVLAWSLVGPRVGEWLARVASPAALEAPGPEAVEPLQVEEPDLEAPPRREPAAEESSEAEAVAEPRQERTPPVRAEPRQPDPAPAAADKSRRPPPAATVKRPSLPEAARESGPGGERDRGPERGADPGSAAEPEPAGRPEGAPAEPLPSARQLAAEIEVDREIDVGPRVSFDVTPADAYVLLDGTVVGQAREWNERRGGRAFELPREGTYVVTFRKIGMADHHVRLRASGAGLGTSVVTVRLEPLPTEELALGDLRRVRVSEAVGFRVRPVDADIVIDGQRVGHTSDYSGQPMRRGSWLELPIGTHRVSLLAPGYRRHDVAVEVSGGARDRRQRIEVELAPEG